MPSVCRFSGMPEVQPRDHDVTADWAVISDSNSYYFHRMLDNSSVDMTAAHCAPPINGPIPKPLAQRGRGGNHAREESPNSEPHTAFAMRGFSMARSQVDY